MAQGNGRAEFELNEFDDPIKSSSATRLSLLVKEFALDRNRRSQSQGQDSFLRLPAGCSGSFVIEPDSRGYRWWNKFILLWAIFSSIFTPFEFGFFRGLSGRWWLLDVATQTFFLVDVLVNFLVAYRDMQTYKMVYQCRRIAWRYAKTSFVLDLLGCFPWDIIYKAAGRKEVVRYLLWIRLYRVRKVTEFFQKMEKDIRINYLFTRIVKLIAVELYCTHTAACIFYYLATTIPASREGFTWIGSLTLGDYHYTDFRDLGLGRRYLTSMYFAIVTMATVGYGDIHAVNPREMIFIMIYVSFDMVLGAYLIGNMTALIVKGSKTERFRDKMTDLIKYMNRNSLGKDIRTQIKSHMRLQYESSHNEVSVLQDIPVSMRAKISQALYKSTVEQVPLFKGCTSEFINQIVTRLHEEFFLPGEVIMEQGNAVDQLYFVSNGSLEEVVIGEDGSDETVALLKHHSLCGEIAVLCNIPQPYTVRVCELSRLLRLDKQSFANIVQLYFVDGRKILNNFLQGKDTDLRIKQLESDITLLIAKQEAELALRINLAASQGDLYHLKKLIRAGADLNSTDYDGRTALHLAASKGYEEIVMILIQEGADVNYADKFGNTPLLEAIKAGNDGIAASLIKKGASLDLEDAGSILCKAVVNGNVELLKRLLANGMDPNSKDYHHQTALHVAAAEGLHLLAKILLESGADVLIKDRWGNTPLDEGRKCGSNPLIQMLEEAKNSCIDEQLDPFVRDQGSSSSQSYVRRAEGNITVLNSTSTTKTVSRGSDLQEGTSFQKLQCQTSESREQMAKTFTVFPFHPWAPREKRKNGLVMWVPETIELLLQTAAEHFGSTGTCILTEEAGQILHTDFIRDGQRVYIADRDQFP